jgi:hypothetical protein
LTTGTFSGNTVTIYTQYLDLGNHGETLVARPSVTYSVTLANGWSGSGLGAVPGDGNWALVPVLGSGTFTAIPGQAVPGLSRPGWPGSVSMMGALPAAARQPADDTDADEAAGRAIFEEIRSRLTRMGDEVKVLRRRQGGGGSGH